MTESALRLAALKLLCIFPNELLPIIDEYIKSKHHEWSVTADVGRIKHEWIMRRQQAQRKFWSITKSRIEVNSSKEDMHSAYAESKFNTDEGPLKWVIECQVGEAPLSKILRRSSEIDVGLLVPDNFGGLYQKKVAHFWRNAGVLTPPATAHSSSEDAHFSTTPNSRATLTVEVDPIGERSITTTFIDSVRKVHREIISYHSWTSFRLYVQLYGNGSVELVTNKP